MYLGYGNFSAFIHLTAKRPSAVLALGAAILLGSYLYQAKHSKAQSPQVSAKHQSNASHRTFVQAESEGDGDVEFQRLALATNCTPEERQSRTDMQPATRARQSCSR